MLFQSPSLLAWASALLLGSGAALSVPLTPRSSMCGGGPWAYGEYHRVGGSGGQPFCATKYKDGLTVRAIEVWGDKKGVEGLQLTYSDESKSDIIGRNKEFSESHRLAWDYKNERIRDLVLYGNGKGTLTGRIFIRTTNNQELDVGKDTSGQDPFNIDVHSGILLGVEGHADWRIDNVGFLFLKSKIKEITITDMKFKDSPENLNSKSEGLEVKTLDEDQYENLTSGNSTFKFGRKIKVHQERTFGTTTSHTFGVEHSITASGQILGIGAETTTSLSYQYFKEIREEETKGFERELDYEYTTVVQPGETVYCRGQAMMGNFDGGYTSRMNVILEDGGSFSFAEEGTMKDVRWSKSDSVCQLKPFKDNDAPRIQESEYEVVQEKRGVIPHA